MKISGYSFVRNATQLDYPIRESIGSILPICDEFVIAYCVGDPGDTTLQEIQALNSDKIKIIKADWEPDKFQHNTLYSYLSDVAKNQCSGDWLFYLQADEVVHEQYLRTIQHACETYVNDKNVDGFLFNYRHFWGDYNHCFTHHGWYPKEIRIIRNSSEIHSWKDAQSFRKYSEFEPTTAFYANGNYTQKLNVVALTAYIYHYGWVRHPEVMLRKHIGFKKTQGKSFEAPADKIIDYGAMDLAPKFSGTHPQIMQQRISLFDWGEMLNCESKGTKKGMVHKHEKFKYRIRSWFEINFLNGRELFGFKNYNLIGKFRD